jgi:Ca2+-binding EF-hand superfamily protein
MQVAMRALECDVKKAEVQHLMQKYSKDDNNEIDQDEFMQISKYQEILLNMEA